MNVDLTVGGVGVSQINDTMGVIQESLRWVPKTLYLGQVYTHLTLGAPFSVSHTLGVIPDEVSVFPRGNVTVWATAGDRELWTVSQVTLRASTAGVPVGIAVHKF